MEEETNVFEIQSKKMSQEGKLILESILGKLLGFEDGASDVLEHLLTIDSREVCILLCS